MALHCPPFPLPLNAMPPDKPFSHVYADIVYQDRQKKGANSLDDEELVDNLMYCIGSACYYLPSISPHQVSVAVEAAKLYLR